MVYKTSTNARDDMMMRISMCEPKIRKKRDRHIEELGMRIGKWMIVQTDMREDMMRQGSHRHDPVFADMWTEMG